MMSFTQRQGYIVLVTESPLRIKVQNLRTGEDASFSSWQELIVFLQRSSEVKGLR